MRVDLEFTFPMLSQIVNLHFTHKYVWQFLKGYKNFAWLSNNMIYILLCKYSWITLTTNLRLQLPVLGEGRFVLVGVVSAVKYWKLGTKHIRPAIIYYGFESRAEPMALREA